MIVASSLLLSGCFGSSKDVSEYIVRAQELKQKGEIDKASVELRKAITIDPVNPQANLALAKIEDETGDVQAAVPHYLRAAVPDAKLIEPQLRIVQILLDSDRYAEATGRVNLALGAFPNNADALAMRADAEERQGQTALAKTDADAALLKDRKNPRALAVTAMLALRNKDGAAALDAVTRGLQSNPKDLRLLQVQAAAFLTLNQPEKAVESLTTIVRAAPQNVGLQRALAQVEADSGDVNGAIERFRAAVRANPSSQDMQLAFVQFLASRKKDGDAATYLRELIASNPQGNVYDLTLAEYYRSKNKLADANAVLDQAAARLKQGPEYLQVENALSKVKMLTGNIDQALQINDHVLEVKPDDPDALLFRAAVEAQGGRTGAAITKLLKIVRDNPVNAQAFRLLASAYLVQNQPKLAADAMQRAASVAVGDRQTQLNLAAFLQQAGQLQSARDLMTRMTLQYPDDAAVWVAEGQQAILRKDWNTVSRAIARLREIPGAGLSLLALDGQNSAARGDLAGATAKYQNAIASDPKVDAGVFGAYARAASAAGKAAEAADFIQSKLASLPSSVQVQAQAALMTLRADAGQFDKAGTAFASAVETSPRDADLYDGYVHILAAQKRWDDAKKVIAAGLAAGCPPGRMLLLQGSMDELSGDVTGALKAYKQSMDADPLLMGAANNYASLLADQDPKNIEALKRARAALSGAEGSSDPLVLDTIAWLDYRLGQFDEAKRLLLQADAGKNSNPQLRFHLAAILIATGDRPGGLALLDTIKGLTFPGSDEMRKLSDS